MDTRPSVPAVSPELIVLVEALRQIVFANLEAERRRGPDRCRKRGVGARRAAIGEPLPPNVTVLGAARSPEFATFLDGRQAAQEILAAFCAKCGACPWAKG